MKIAIDVGLSVARTTDYLKGCTIHIKVIGHIVMTERFQSDALVQASL
ncbi:hypothetical protein [Bacillus thuringiensis]|nr:hypothetical protein [Bacillus thuringiensis]